MTQGAAAAAKDEALGALRRGDLTAARAAASRAVELDGSYAEGWAARGTASLMAGDAAAAEADLAQAVALKPVFAEAHLNHAIALIALGRLDDAERAIVLARTAAPALAVDATYRQLMDLRRAEFERTQSRESGMRFALMLSAAGQAKEAEAVFDTCLRLFPNDSDVWMLKSDLAVRQRRFPDAIAAARKATQIKPLDPEPAINLVHILSDSGERAAAAQNAYLAVEKFPASERAWTLLADLVRDDFAKGWDAVKAAALAPDASAAALSRALWAAAERVEWDLGDQLRTRLIARLSDDAVPDRANPLRLMVQAMDPRLIRRNAEAFSRAQYPDRRALAPEPTQKTKLRIGYLSPDFRDHPVGTTVLDLLRSHDRARTEIYAYAIGPDSDGPERRAIVSAVDRFAVLSSLSDYDAARKIRDDDIDILIDLAGHTQHSRLGILSFRPAPLQLHYLGYPGTIGAPFIDYLFGDPWTVPGGAEADFSEAIIRLPHTYLINSHRPAAAADWDRARFGFAPGAVVLCCFNHPHKITRDLFGAWMTVLEKVPEAVLWLRADRSIAETNLRAAAQARGIAADRLHFAPRADMAIHLARYGAVDLMLDTAPYNAHTTAADALWMGCPVLTVPGDTFAARVCAGLLAAIGADDLIAADLDDYVRRAVALAQDRAALARLRERLAGVRDGILFDNVRFARDFEAGLFAAWTRRLQGAAPRTFDAAARAEVS